ncbi:unnamed protein product [Pleuronectes platessa]|uniref:Uncharacterized protein n=1 Tax=Pleuronectes platessa TaxID=8262 RepID=A0A9N7Y8L6_PLEPL|nr:unnamed protein product [Pleuronectes platessa]
MLTLATQGSGIRSRPLDLRSCRQKQEGEAQGTHVFPILLPSGEADTGEPPVTTRSCSSASPSFPLCG